MFENLSFIISSYELLIILGLCGISGILCLITALKSCGVQGFHHRALKYFFGLGAISFLSTFFIVLVQPEYFYNGISSLMIIQTCFTLVVIWISVHELHELFKLAKSDRG